jgi:hypothetical protein
MRRRETPQIPLELYQHLTASQNTEQTVKAMELFLREGHEEKFEFAVALYVASSRYRQEPIEKVTGALCELAGNLEGPRTDGELLLRPTRLHQLIFNGILRAFYGDEAVDQALGASAQRKADAPQHMQSGTWPKRPAQ